MTRKMVGLVAALLMILSACGSDAATGPSEGIGVQGAWTIEVFNADGSLDHHQEFHNALDSAGAVALASLLAGDQSPNTWVISLDNTAQTDDPCVTAGGVAVPCGIWEPSESGSQDATANSFNLTVDAVESIPASGVFDSVRLAGSVTASADGAIGIVSTRLRTCGVGEASCGNFDQPFTSTTLLDPSTGADAPISVTVGQTVQVEVVLSFGTL